MNKMLRRAEHVTVKNDDISTRHLTDWDDKVERAIKNDNSWKYCLMASLGVLAFSVAGNIWLADRSTVQVVHVVHDSIGRTISISVDSAGSGEPSQAMLQRDIEDWISDAKTVGVDTLALKKGIIRAYNQVDKGTQARADLDGFYQAHDPFQTAAEQTVSVLDPVAIPPTSSDIGPDKKQTWATSWTERVESRDGQTVHDQHWTGNITFTVKKPSPDIKPEDVVKNPDGVHIQAYKWMQRS